RNNSHSGNRNKSISCKSSNGYCCQAMIINMIMNMTIYDIGELTLDAAEKEIQAEWEKKKNE
ncbi:MAG TPA: hypothetical protein PLK68_08240, partial [Thomasclavelia ramosa]|nr:hypothetical protein [Thomasclavelia ramosa]